MNAHEADHELLLAEVLSGERARDDGDVAARLARCEVCRARLEALSPLVADVAAAARERREVLNEVAAGVPVPGEEEVERILVRERRRPAERARGLRDAAPDGTSRPITRSGVSWARLRTYAAAAAAVVLVLLLVRNLLREPDASGSSGFLGADASVLEAPLGAVDGYAPFRWESAQPGASFEVRVFDDTDTHRGHPVDTSPRLDQPTWKPATDTWPARIRWQLRVFDAGGAPIGSHEGHAQRSPSSSR